MTKAREFIWRRVLDDLSFELGRFEQTADGPRLTGTIFVAQQNAPLRVDYAITCDADWRTRSAFVEQGFHGARKTLRLDHDGAGAWLVDGAPAPALDGCADVDLGFSPSTNALPVNRLNLAVGAAGAIKAAWVRFPELEVEAASQSYERLGETTYRYRSLTTKFETIVEVDRDGFPVDYQGVWRRIAEGAAPLAGAAAAPKKADFARALLAPGPASELGEAAQDFGWLAGGWSAEVKDFDPDGSVREGRGEWWFAWVLEGRAMQDVWISPPRAERATPRPPNAANDRYGSTIRYFERDAARWRVVWINPVSGVETRLAGGREGDRIVLIGEQDGKRLQWEFHEIAEDGFRWTGRERRDDGSWVTRAEFRLRRIARSLL